MELFAWSLAAGGVVATALASALWRGEKARADEARAAVDGLRGELQDREAQRERAAEKKRGNADELQELRRRLEKTKKRAFEASERLKPALSRIEELEAQAAVDDREASAKREALDAAGARLRAIAAERSALADRVRILEDAPKSEPVSAPPDTSELDDAQRRVTSLERELREAQHEGARYRQRSRTHQRLYMVIHGELELAKDRIRELQGHPPTKRPTPPVVELPEGAADEATTSS